MLNTKVINDIHVVSFNNTDKFNALITEPVKEELKSFYTNKGVKLALDLSGIRFIDSSGFSVFLSVMKTANSNSGQFRICNASDEVMDLFKLLQLHTVFSIHPDIDSCLGSFE